MIHSLIIFHFKKQSRLKLEINPHNIPLFSFIGTCFKIALFCTILNNFIFCILNIYYKWLFTKIFLICVSCLTNQFSAFIIQYIKICWLRLILIFIRMFFNFIIYLIIMQILILFNIFIYAILINSLY